MLALTGCGHAVTGTAVPAAAPPDSVDLRALDTGTYPTTPAPTWGTAGTEDAGRRAEGQRLAGHVVGPWQVDPRFVDGSAGPAAIVTEPKHLGAVLWPTLAAPVHGHPFLVAFSADRHVTDPGDPTALRNTVLLFATAEAATAVAEGMSQTAMDGRMSIEFYSPVPTEPVRAVPIPGHPDSTGAVLTHIVDGVEVRELTAITAHGRFVLVEVARSAEGPDRAAEFAGRALDLQIPLLEDFTPTDPTHLAELSLDPAGLLARTLPLPTVGGGLANTTFDQRGAVHLEDHPIDVAEALADAGVDAVVNAGDSVYRAGDPDRARRLADRLADLVAAGGAARPGPAVPGLPSGHCLSDTGGLVVRHRCFAAVDRYVIKSVAQQLNSAQQQVAAQYRMLTG